MPLRITVDARSVATDTRGIGRYQRAVLRRLLARDDAAITLLIPEFMPVLRKPALAGVLGRSNFAVRSKVPRNADVVWFPASGAFFETAVPFVVTLHDAKPFRYPNDDAVKREREQAPLRYAADAATHIITVSEFAKREIASVFDVDPRRITAISNGVDDRLRVDAPASLLPQAVQGRRYVFFAGETERSKGVDTLLAAYERIRAAQPDVLLVLSGKRGNAAPHEFPPGVIEAGVVDDATLAALYKHAAAFLFPSRYEGFGLPVLEAMAHETPVVAADHTAIPEVAGDAALLVAVDDAAAYADGVLLILNDPAYADLLRARGRARAATLTYDRTADRTFDILKTAAR